jgi:hypothetical protein
MVQTHEPATRTRVAAHWPGGDPRPGPLTDHGPLGYAPTAVAMASAEALFRRLNRPFGLMAPV